MRLCGVIVAIGERNLHREFVKVGAAMTHLPGPPTSRIGAAINDEPQSSRNQSVRAGRVAQEAGVTTAPHARSTTTIEELQRVYSSRLFQTILRITKNWEDAEDALQDTFLRAYLAWDGFEGRSTPYSWLTRIAINSALMLLRRRRSRPEALLVCSFEEGDSNFPMELKDSSSNPEQLCELRQRKDQLLKAIRKLESPLRAPIETQLAGEHSVKEVAETLSISVAAVKARLYRARLRLIERASVHSSASRRAPAGVANPSARANLKNREQQWTTFA